MEGKEYSSTVCTRPGPASSHPTLADTRRPGHTPFSRVSKQVLQYENTRCLYNYEAVLIYT